VKLLAPIADNFTGPWYSAPIEAMRSSQEVPWDTPKSFLSRGAERRSHLLYAKALQATLKCPYMRWTLHATMNQSHCPTTFLCLVPKGQSNGTRWHYSPTCLMAIAVLRRPCATAALIAELTARWNPAYCGDQDGSGARV